MRGPLDPCDDRPRLRRPQRSSLAIGSIATSDPLVSDAKEHDDCPVNCDQLFVAYSAQKRTELASANSRDLVDHRVGLSLEARGFTSRDRYSKEWSWQFDARQGTDRDRICCVVAVILNDHYWSRFSRVTRATGHGPNLAAFQLSNSLIESTNS